MELRISCQVIDLTRSSHSVPSNGATLGSALNIGKVIACAAHSMEHVVAYVRHVMCGSSHSPRTSHAKVVKGASRGVAPSRFEDKPVVMGPTNPTRLRSTTVLLLDPSLEEHSSLSLQLELCTCTRPTLHTHVPVLTCFASGPLAMYCCPKTTQRCSSSCTGRCAVI